MGVRSLIGLAILALSFAFVGCESDKAQKVQPETRGKRGERCMARNDCDSGLACLNNICAKNEFDIDVSAKHCDRVECSEDVDCCGDRPLKAPSKCKNREEICTPTLPGCTATNCTATGVCAGGGTCSPGICSSPGSGSCIDAEECHDVCDLDTGLCTRSSSACDEDTDCLHYSYNATATCSNRICNCANPDYVAGAEICTDPDCEDLCLLRCENEVCVQNASCETPADCSAAAPLCDGGRCVQCLGDEDCDEEEDETCEKGFCHKPCKVDEECGLFEKCDDGDCVYVGCQDDKECILAAARGQEGVGETPSSGDDPRLFKCLPSEVEAGVNTCKIPCENDGSCGKFQVCDKGYCKFIGCETDEQCRAYLGIANQSTSEQKPYLTKAVCRE